MPVDPHTSLDYKVVQQVKLCILMNEEPSIPPPSGADANPDRKVGLAEASFLMGIGSLATLPITIALSGGIATGCMGFLLGVTAVITGVIALVRRSQIVGIRPGAGLAITGLLAGTPIVVIALVDTLLCSSSNAHDRRANACINNLKTIGLAGRIYANDHDGRFPDSFAIASNELTAAKILTCPSDQARQPALTFAALTATNITYEMLNSNLSNIETQKVFARCPIHKQVVLVDGSVHPEAKKWIACRLIDSILHP